MASKAGKMPYMTAYNKGYVPPEGSAGGEAIGVYSNKKNPRPVPKKGSQLGYVSDYGMNADKSKVKSMQEAQAKKENLRGIGC
jgi:hypothetical protein